MKKIIVLATAAFLVSGIAFAHGDDKKGKGKECCKKEVKGKNCCKKEATARETAKTAVKKV